MILKKKCEIWQKSPKHLSSKDQSLDLNHSESMWNNFYSYLENRGGGVYPQCLDWLTSLDMGRTNVPPPPIFRIVLKKLFHIDCEWLNSRDSKSSELRCLGYFFHISDIDFFFKIASFFCFFYLSGGTFVPHVQTG